MKLKNTILTISILAGLFFAGCGCPAQKQVAVPPDPGLCSAPGMVASAMQYPVGNAYGRAIHLSKLTPTQVIVNEPFDYKIKVQNLTSQELINVVVSDAKPEHMTINSSDPDMRVVEGKVLWDLGTLAPNESRTISISAVAVDMGSITTCAEVTFETPTCAQIDIVRPQLTLSKVAPSESIKCDRIPLTYILTNEGSAAACDVVIEDVLPDGMMTSTGDNVVSFNVDSIGPGESQEFEAVVDASTSGIFASNATASSKSSGTITSNMPETMINQPALAIKETCPAAKFIGKSLTYEITVSNTGNGVARDTIIAATIPENTQYKKSSGGGMYTHASPGVVTWKIGDLAPGETRDVSMKLLLDKPGTLFTMATAKAFCAETASDSCRTELEGIPAVLLEVVDISDPIELGAMETYIITVTNQGTAEDTNIVINALLEDTMEYVSSSGPTKASVSGNKIAFEPLASLATDGQASWKVNVKAIGEGDVRFRATMNTDQLGRVVLETEATRFYQDLD
ncbi:MAG: hypothetical protein FVQ82_16050 [Planctomycetes bacterium]|nr:hypothetical protein [Planctomycetota bacterium]